MVRSRVANRTFGEQPIGTAARAIANAVLDAAGVKITELPITSEKVHRALQSGEG